VESVNSEIVHIENEVVMVHQQERIDSAELTKEKLRLIRLCSQFVPFRELKEIKLLIWASEDFDALHELVMSVLKGYCPIIAPEIIENSRPIVDFGVLSQPRQRSRWDRIKRYMRNQV
jgi:hypothetical protein